MGQRQHVVDELWHLLWTALQRLLERTGAKRNAEQRLGDRVMQLPRQAGPLFQDGGIPAAEELAGVLDRQRGLLTRGTVGAVHGDRDLVGERLGKARLILGVHALAAMVEQEHANHAATWLPQWQPATTDNAFSGKRLGQPVAFCQR